MKKSILGILLLCSTPSLLPVTTGLSCLYNPETQQKVAIVRDNYIYSEPGEYHQDIVSDQTQDLTGLVETLSTSIFPATFLCDGSGHAVCPTKEESISFPYIAWVAPRLFLDQGTDRLGNVSLDMFAYGEQSPIDSLLLSLSKVVDIEDWFSNKENVDRELSQCVDTAPFTIEFYLKCLEKRKQDLVSTVDALPSVYSSIKEELQQAIDTLFNQLIDYIHNVSHEYNLKPSDNICWVIPAEYDKCSYSFSQQLENLCYRENDTNLVCKALYGGSLHTVVQCKNDYAGVLNRCLQKAGFKSVSINEDDYSCNVDTGDLDTYTLFRRNDHNAGTYSVRADNDIDFETQTLDLELNRALPAFFNASL